MFGAQVCSVVRWLFWCGLVGLLVVLILPLFFSFLAMQGLCCFLRVTLDLHLEAAAEACVIDITCPTGSRSQLASGQAASWGGFSVMMPYLDSHIDAANSMQP